MGQGLLKPHEATTGAGANARFFCANIMDFGVSFFAQFFRLKRSVHNVVLYENESSKMLTVEKREQIRYGTSPDELLKKLRNGTIDKEEAIFAICTLCYLCIDEALEKGVGKTKRREFLYEARRWIDEMENLVT